MESTVCNLLKFHGSSINPAFDTLEDADAVIYV